MHALNVSLPLSIPTPRSIASPLPKPKASLWARGEKEHALKQRNMNSKSSVSLPLGGTLWFYADTSNQPVGPLPLGGLEQLAAAGLIHARTKVIENGGTEWRRYAEITPYPISTQQMRWFYSDAGSEPVGPVPFAELQKLAMSGVIRPKTQVIEEGGSVWRTFDEIALEPIAAKSNERTPPLLTKAHTSSYTSVRKFTILALGFIYPLGLLMLWRYSDFSKRTKILVTSICSPIFLIGISSGLGIIATPVTLLLIWVWLGKAFSKVSQIALTIACTLLFLPIILPLQQSTNYVRESSPMEKQKTNNASNSSPAGKQATAAQKILVRAKTTLYEDEETLRVIKTEWDKGESSGNEASERLRKARKMWTEEYDISATVLREGGPMNSAFVEAKEPAGLRASRFWVLKPLIPLDSPSAQQSIRKEFARRKSDFVFTFTGENGKEIGGSMVSNLAEMIEGIYTGQIPIREASRYLFRMEAIEARLVRVRGEYIIYEAVVHPRKQYEFAMKRDPALERDMQIKYGSLEEYYEDIRQADFHSDNPLIKGPIMVVATEPFTTGAGLVKMGPVVRVVNLTP